MPSVLIGHHSKQKTRERDHSHLFSEKRPHETILGDHLSARKTKRQTSRTLKKRSFSYLRYPVRMFCYSILHKLIHKNSLSLNHCLKMFLKSFPLCLCFCLLSLKLFFLYLQLSKTATFLCVLVTVLLL